VAVNYASSREGAEQVAADIKANGGEAIAVKGDVAKAADVRGLFEAPASRWLPMSGVRRRNRILPIS
jgi:3-oxoacyl-[acyl-carrier protein] reductase